MVLSFVTVFYVNVSGIGVAYLPEKGDFYFSGWCISIVQHPRKLEG